MKYCYWLYYYEDELYAYTDSKEHMRLFDQDRDLQKLKKIKSKLNSDQVHELAVEFNGLYLSKYDMSMVDKANNKKINSIMALTKTEITTITARSVQLMQDEIYKHCWYNPLIFKDKIVKALEVVQYNKLFREIMPKDYSELFYEFKNEDCEIIPDEFSIFIHYYGKTLKG